MLLLEDLQKLLQKLQQENSIENSFRICAKTSICHSSRIYTHLIFFLPEEILERLFGPILHEISGGTPYRKKNLKNVPGQFSNELLENYKKKALQESLKGLKKNFKEAYVVIMTFRKINVTKNFKKNYFEKYQSDAGHIF